MMIPETKKCVKCNLVKKSVEFSINAAKKDGLTSRCKKCQRLYSRIRSTYLFREYGITEAQYELMSESQNGVCAICKQSETRKFGKEKVKYLSVDHDHNSFKIRGLLCSKCNNMLSNAKDNPEILRKAAEYLEKHK